MLLFVRFSCVLINTTDVECVYTKKQGDSTNYTNCIYLSLSFSFLFVSLVVVFFSHKRPQFDNIYLFLFFLLIFVSLLSCCYCYCCCCRCYCRSLAGEIYIYTTKNYVYLLLVTHD